MSSHPRFLSGAVLLAVLAIVVPGAGMGQNLPDSAETEQIIDQLAAEYMAVKTTDAAYISFFPFWKDVLLMLVPYGLDQDAVPPPLVFYLLPDRTVVSGFQEVLEKRTYHPADAEDALNIVTLLLEDIDRYALAVTNDSTLTLIPGNVRKEYNVRVPDVVTTDDGYSVTMFTYQTYKGQGFSRHYRSEVLTRHSIDITDGTYVFSGKEAYLIKAE